MRILALDLGSTAGWAWWNPVLHSVQYNTWTNKAGRYDGGGMRYLRFRNWLSEMKDLLGIERVVFEEVRNHKGTDAAHVYGGLLAHLTAWCEEQQPPIPYEGIPVGTIKKHIWGKGNASKEQVKAAVAAKLCITTKDDNVADALALLDFVLHRDTGSGVTAKPRKRVRVKA